MMFVIEPFPLIANQLPEILRRFLPSKRDREVPYGMKGGECDGRKEESR